VLELTVNGKPRTIEHPTTLLDFLEQLGVNPHTVAVEHNGEIIRRERYGEAQLQAGDVLEIVRMVGGGEDDRPAGS
jgi:sulfur carrier protein